jgi:hypothetical protein
MKNHVRECYAGLTGSSSAYARTGISFTKAEQSALEKGSKSVERKSGPTLTLQDYQQQRADERQVSPNNLCIWRKVHSFVEVPISAARQHQRVCSVLAHLMGLPRDFLSLACGTETLPNWETPTSPI